MPIIDRHNPGAFCWFELATTDQNAAKDFYTSLFGWTVTDSPMGPDEVYSMFSLEGRNVAGGYKIRADETMQGVPPHWMVYVCVNSADQTVKKVQDAGGKVHAAPFDVMEHGRMAVFADPTGAVFSVWEPKQHTGVGTIGVDGTVCWADLSTPDVEAAQRFYSDVFGWQIEAAEHDPSGYLHIKNGSEYIGGVPPAAQRPPGVPPHWLIYFLASNCDSYLGKAKDLGAQVLFGPQDLPHVGRMAIIKDPQGVVFALFQPESK